MSWWEFRGFWGILQRSRLEVDLPTQKGRLKPLISGFQTTFVVGTVKAVWV